MIDVLTDGIRAAVGPVAMYYALAALGLNLHFGYTGLLNFGQVGFMLVGGYGLAISVAIWGWPFWLGVLFGLALSAVLALLLGVPTLRLRADYLAITTIAAAEILRFVTNSTSATDLTAGPFGIPSQISNGQGFVGTFNNLNPLPDGRYGFGGMTYSENITWLLIVGWTAVVVLALLIGFLMRSPWGRLIKAIREDEDAVRALGKNVFVYKMQSLVLGGMLGGLAGIAFALSQASVSPGAFLPQVTFYAYAILILGGTATTWGPVVGAIAFQFLIAASDSFMRSTEIVPSNNIGTVRFMLVGLVLMLLTVFRPQGILGNKREMMLDV